MIFEEKYSSQYILLTDQILLPLITFTSSDNGQYVYCNYLFASL